MDEQEVAELRSQIKSVYAKLSEIDNVFENHEHKGGIGSGIKITLDSIDFDHGDLSGKDDDDHTQYVLRQPTADTVINESGGDFNWRMEGVGQPNLLFLDAGNNYVGIGTNLPTSQFHIQEDTNDLWIQLYATTGKEAGIKMTERIDGTFGFAIYHDGGANALKMDSIDGSFTQSTMVLIHRVNDVIGLVGITSPVSTIEVGGVKDPVSGVGALSNYTLGLRNVNDSNGISSGIALTTIAYTDTNITASVIAVRTGAYGKGELRFYTKQSATDGVAPVQGMTLKDNGTIELSSGVGVDKILDEDDMASDDALALATQQSIKAYVNANAVPLKDTLLGDLWTIGNANDGLTEITPSASTITRRYSVTELESDGSVGGAVLYQALTDGNDALIGGQDMDMGCVIRLSTTVTQNAFWGMDDGGFGTGLSSPFNGTTTEDHIGFFILDNTIWASNANGTTQTRTSIGSITLTNMNSYYWILNAGVDIKFYINGVLEATHTTNLPDETNPPRIWFGMLRNSGSTVTKLYLSNSYFTRITY